MVRISWTKLAVEDLKNIATYIARNSKQYARIQVIKLKSKTLILKQNPYAGRTVPEFSNNKFRELIEGNYRIIYKVVNESQVDILTIHHAARDLSKRPVE